MFHKALWIRNYKQGKYVIWLFWLSTLYVLPYKYYTHAQQMAEYFRLKKSDPYYMYSLQGADTMLFPTLLLVGLAILLIGWERHNQTIDFLWSMPFKRSSLFLSKWLLGTVHIVSAISLNWLLMYIIYRNTIHVQYQSFSPFHVYFTYTIITLIAVYTFTLFIGTITGNIISQSVLSYILMIFPLYICMLVFPFFILHKESNYIYTKYVTYTENTSVVAPITHFTINYDYDSQRDTFKNEFGNIQVGPDYHHIPSVWTLLSPAIYILICLPLGAYLYTRAPNEHNGKILLYPRLHVYFLICTSICFGLLGGVLFTNGVDSLPLYYIYFIGSGILTYAILHRLLKHKLSLYAK